MFYIYILANRKHGAIFTGQCDNLLKRVREHKIQRFNGARTPYNIDRLMWFEGHATRASALKREKDIRSWTHEARLGLFAKSNPEWKDLSLGLSERDVSDSHLRRSVPLNGNNANDANDYVADTDHLDWALAS